MSSSWMLATSSSLSSPNGQQSSATSSWTVLGTQTEPSSSSSPVPQTSVQSSKNNNALIIGGAVGGVALVVAGLALIFYLRRRRNTQAQTLVEVKNVDNARLSPGEASSSESLRNHNSSVMSSAPFVGPDDWRRSNRPQSFVDPPSVMGINNVEELEADEEQEVRLYEDGGVRIAGGSLRRQVVDVPPEYREYD
ncbi:uncharacterized protein EDB91DRAFT_307675 [Suillus paluster]|uniref:uncharacterized protein n=1 Tax=Suillus paluster TaxID=48578 RepID=UPI001B8704DC|nr:uncharacterized protein EDB91DRAFT_307675 [Suillus paluster]KAG1742336.1 hypothetical protein EDB91DRAFT_307675 [Suillus paluster]